MTSRKLSSQLADENGRSGANLKAKRSSEEKLEQQETVEKEIVFTRKQLN